MSAAGEPAPPNTVSLPLQTGSEHAEGERLLVEQAREGNRDAFRLLVHRYNRQVYNIAYRFVGDHESAQDITQEAFVKVFHALGSFRGDAEFGTWLYRIVVNLALTRKRLEHSKQRRRVTLEIAIGIGVEPKDDMVAREEQSHVEQALHELPTMQRAVIILRHLNGLSTRQVSRILNCSEGTVKTHLFRGLKTLRRKLSYLQEG
jgi:RNA polymerase sigma-70 factor (ECF subfamily)